MIEIPEMWKNKWPSKNKQTDRQYITICLFSGLLVRSGPQLTYPLIVMSFHSSPFNWSIQLLTGFKYVSVC